MSDRPYFVSFELAAETVVFVSRGLHSDLRPQGLVLHHQSGLLVNDASATEVVLWSDRSPHSVEVLAPAGVLTVWNVWREGRETFGLIGEAGIATTDLFEGAVMIECSDGHPPAESVDLRVELAFWDAVPSEGESADLDGADLDVAAAIRPDEVLLASSIGSVEAPADGHGPRMPRPGWLRAPRHPVLWQFRQVERLPASGAEPTAAPSADGHRPRSPRPGWLRAPRHPLAWQFDQADVPGRRRRTARRLLGRDRHDPEQHGPEQHGPEQRDPDRLSPDRPGPADAAQDRLESAAASRPGGELLPASVAASPAPTADGPPPRLPRPGWLRAPRHPASR